VQPQTRPSSTNPYLGVQAWFCKKRFSFFRNVIQYQDIERAGRAGHFWIRRQVLRVSIEIIQTGTQFAIHLRGKI